ARTPAGIGPNAILSTTITCTCGACAVPVAVADAAPAISTRRPASMITMRGMSCSLLQTLHEMLGVHLVRLEQLQAGFQQRFQLRVLRRRDQRAAQRIIDGLVKGDFVRRIGLVVRRATERGEFRLL